MLVEASVAAGPGGHRGLGGSGGSGGHGGSPGSGGTGGRGGVRSPGPGHAAPASPTGCRGAVLRSTAAVGQVCPQCRDPQGRVEAQEQWALVGTLASTERTVRNINKKTSRGAGATCRSHERARAALPVGTLQLWEVLRHRSQWLKIVLKQHRSFHEAPDGYDAKYRSGRLIGPARCRGTCRWDGPTTAVRSCVTVCNR